jgi:hypothetical protein
METKTRITPACHARRSNHIFGNKQERVRPRKIPFIKVGKGKERGTAETSKRLLEEM